jgi:hypothetical protein
VRLPTGLRVVAFWEAADTRVVEPYIYAPALAGRLLPASAADRTSVASVVPRGRMSMPLE